MVDLMYRTLMFCQFFFRSDTKKLTASCTLRAMSLLFMVTLATQRDMHITFFIWNLMVATDQNCKIFMLFQDHRLNW